MRTIDGQPSLRYLELRGPQMAGEEYDTAHTPLRSRVRRLGPSRDRGVASGLLCAGDGDRHHFEYAVRPGIPGLGRGVVCRRYYRLCVAGIVDGLACRPLSPKDLGRFRQ